MKLFKNKHLVSLCLIILVSIILRFYGLGQIPAGLLNDEANLGYDAYSLLQTAKDQWGTFLPINNFIGFGDFQPPVGRYLSILPIFFFGLGEFSVRFSSALSGVLSVIALYYLVKKLFNENIALLSSFVFAIMPWAVGLNRIYHESNIAILFLLVALIFGLIKKSGWGLYISAIFLALSVYTYSAYTLFAPLVLFVILFFNYKNNVKFKHLFKVLILFLILISPIFIQKNAASIRFSQVGLTNNINSVGLINVLNDERGQCLSSFNPLICKVNNKAILFIGTFTKNYFSHLSPNFLYTSGTSTQLSILPQRGLDYLFNFVPFIIGFIFLIKEGKDKKLNNVIIILFLLSFLPDSLTSDGNYVRASIMQPFIAIITGLGYYYLINFVGKRYKKIKYVFPLLLLFIVSFSLISFFVLYNSYFKNNNATFSQYGYKELVENIKENENKFDKIYISRHLNDTKQYIYYLFYTKYDPSLYQKQKDIEYSNQGGWISVDRLGKLYFVDNLPGLIEMEDLSRERVLIVSHPAVLPKDLSSTFVVKDRLGNVIFKAVTLSDLLEYNKVNKELTKQ